MRLAAAQDRLAALHALARRYGPSVDEVIAWADGARARCSSWTGSTTGWPSSSAAAAAFDELGDLAAALSAARRDAGTALRPRSVPSWRIWPWAAPASSWS